MAEPVNVAFNVTERGFDKILRDVGLLRSELEALGVDVSGPVQRALNGIETTSVKVTRAIKNIGSTSDEAGKSLKGWSESMTQVWARQFREAEKAEKQIRSLKAASDAARASETGGRNYANASTSIDSIISAREKVGRDFSAQLRAQLQASAKAADEEGRAIDRATRAAEKRTKAEYELNRARAQRQKSTETSDFDAEFDALTKLTQANDEAANPSTRYALYDVAAAYTAIGASLAGVAIYAGIVGADFQAAFASVVRTTDPLVATDEYVQNLRDSLVQLSGQVPLTFRELSEIATLGNQLGINEDAIDSFTATVARFASVSGVSAEEVSRAFGGIAAQTGLSEKYFENLASAMALVSVRSNATEAQIISLTREIAASASLSGFAIDEVVGLAGALASLQVAPERARGVLDTYFTQLNTAVREGGESLEAFSAITGRTGEDLENLVRSGEGLEVFRSVLQGLASNSADVADLDANLEALGLTGLRASNTFQRFVNSLGVADDAFADANEGFMSGEEAIRQYGITAETLEAQFTILINGVNALVDAVSGGAVKNLGALLQVVNNLIFAFAEWLRDNRWVAALIGIGIAVAGVTGALFLVRGGLAVARAASLAMAQATAALSGTALASSASLGTLTKALFGVQVGMTRAAAAGAIFRRSLPGLAATAGVLVLSYLAENFFQVEDKAGSAALEVQEYKQIVEASKFSSEGAGGAADGLAKSLGGNSGSGGVAKAAEEAAIKVRTLTDYVNDLNGVFNRSEDLRFGSSAAIDEITLKWLELNEEIEKYQQQIRSLTAERGLKEYFLGIAEAYDDQLRAAQLREEIAKIDDQLADAQAGASTELTGNTRAAIENRKVFRDLLGSYEDYVSALASAGASQEQIQAVISQLNGDFNAQATALGFNSGELQAYGDRFNDLATIVAQVPRNVTVNFDGRPAEQALAEFFAKAEESARQAGTNAGNGFGDGFGGGIGGGGGGGEIPFDDFFEIGVDKAPDFGKGAGDLWLEALVGSLITGDFDTFWKKVQEGGEAAWQGIQAAGDAFGNWLSDLADGTIWSDNFGESIKGGLSQLTGEASPIRNWLADQDAQAGAGATQIGANYANTIANSTQATLNPLNPLTGWLATQNGLLDTGGQEAGTTFGTGVNDKFLEVVNQGDPLAGWITEQNKNASINSGIIGNNFGNGFSNATTITLNSNSPLTGWLAAQNNSAYANGSSIGSGIGGGIAAGLANALSSVNVTGGSAKTYNPKTGRFEFAEGGYTGPGHWLKPAGIVHAGEYVIPKRHVNQSTGLPDPSYVANLQRGRSAPQRGYASGGYVGGQDGPVDLTAGTINAITRGLSVSLNVGSTRLAKSVSKGNESLSFTGSN